MTTKTAGRKVIKSSNGVELVREYYYGFGCNSLDTQWFVLVDGEMRHQAPKLKAIQPWFNREVAQARAGAEAQARADEQSNVLATFNELQEARCLLGELRLELAA
jgi:hypothetical protein